MGASGTLGVVSGVATITKQFANDFDNATGAANLVLNKAALLAASASGSTGIYSYSVSVLKGSAEFEQGAMSVMLKAGDSENREGTDNDDNTLSSADDFTLTIPVGGACRLRWVEIV